ncbi:MAG TPA: glycoside hydrolase family 2 TIM barrel-domain containing protein [bacterium]|nr:glycoside hydrolase family 2 TIM barrel-domain containing protein [bacterium]
MKEFSLNGNWELRDEPLDSTEEEAARIAQEKTTWMVQPVPGDIHQGLILSGRIKEPLVGLNSFDAQWTENRSWWFRKTFQTRKEWLEAESVELELDGLDGRATVFLNGLCLGRHESAFYPFRRQVKNQFRVEGANTLLVRLTSGVEEVTESELDSLGVRASTEAANNRPERGDARRVFVRKPQYSFGWDWSPRVATTAIAGEAKIISFSKGCLRDVRVKPVRDGKEIFLEVVLTVDFLHYYRTGEGSVEVKITAPDRSVTKAKKVSLLRSGLNYVEFTLPVKNPELWWPNGTGQPHLYRVAVKLAVEGEVSAFPEFETGIRFVELDTDRKFAFVINGKKVFCKGANWIPADAIYARVTAAKYEHLIQEARKANFNMLRVWGGSRYEPETFYQLCDRYGIMVWHDFMFACAPYPDHLDWFLEEVKKEAEYQTRRLRNHPCMVLWCGNNECTQLLGEWRRGKTRSGAALYNYLLPETVRTNCPEIPYWNGSPYGGEIPNASDVGDRHHWADCMMSPDMNKRITPEEYDQCRALFVSEYGYVSAPVKETVLDYFGEEPVDRKSKTWQHHTNTFEKNTVEAGIRKHYADPENLSLEQYLLYSGLCQGLMYGYSLDSFRRRENCHGALFWMYEDCWGEIGWTIMDYYRRRKIAWYFVKRALAPVRLILREKDGLVSVTMANDLLEPVKGILTSGYTSFDGKESALRQKKIFCPGLTRKILATFKRGNQDASTTLWIARMNRKDILPAILRIKDFRLLRTVKPELSLSIRKQGKDLWKISVASQVFAPAVHFQLPEDALPEDSYFDLLPGERREIMVSYTGRLSPEKVTVKTVIGHGQD